MCCARVLCACVLIVSLQHRMKSVVVVSVLLLSAVLLCVSGAGAGAVAGSGAHKKRAHARAHHHKQTATEVVPAVKHTAVVQWSAGANKYFFTPNALTYVGHEDTIVAAWGVFADTLHSTYVTPTARITH